MGWWIGGEGSGNRAAAPPSLPDPPWGLLWLSSGAGLGCAEGVVEGVDRKRSRWYLVSELCSIEGWGDWSGAVLSGGWVCLMCCVPGCVFRSSLGFVGSWVPAKLVVEEVGAGSGGDRTLGVWQQQM